MSGEDLCTTKWQPVRILLKWCRSENFLSAIKGSSGSSLNSHNVAFLSIEDTNSINKVNTANGVSTVASHGSPGQSSSSLYANDLMFSFFANQSD
ncbi:hypothetical protein Tco_0230807 [Tanacetum coccineum]